jgi:hypothetical protein
MQMQNHRRRGVVDRQSKIATALRIANSKVAGSGMAARYSITPGGAVCWK